jgi:hypothetical protein
MPTFKKPTKTITYAKHKCMRQTYVTIAGNKSQLYGGLISMASVALKCI